MHVTMIAAMSADGFIAQEASQSSMVWTSEADRKFFIDKTKEIGTVIMGRKTFETFGKPLKNRLLVVMTSEPAKYTSQPDLLEFTSNEPAKILADLEKRGKSSVVLGGGAGVYGMFLKAGLVDELYLTVEPIIFSAGVKLAENCGRVDMELIDTVKLGGQAALLHFRINKKGS